MFVGLAVNRGLQSEVAEARSLSRSHVYSGPSAGEFHRAFLVSLQHVVGYFVVHLAVSRYAVFIQLHLNLSLFARLIEPVGMVGHGQPQIVRAVRIVFGCGIEPCGNGKDKRKTILFIGCSILVFVQR